MATSHLQVTVIVPVYNAKPYLHACINSILSQSYHDYELLLIDDGSTDGSSELCDEYAGKDRRIRVYHKENGGVSSARNIGLDMAQGEWICFVDADDTLAEGGLQTLANGISDIVAMVMGEYSKCLSEYEIAVFSTTATTKVLSRKQVLQQLMKPADNHYQGYLWNKLFRADCIRSNGIRFNEDLYFGEDRLFVVQYLCASKGDVFYTTQPVYNYYLRKESAMGTLQNGYNPKFAIDVQACVLAKECVSGYTKNLKLRHAALWMVCESAIKNLYMMKQYRVEDKQLRNEIQLQLRQSGAYPLFILKYVIKRILHPEYFRTT